MSHATTPTPPPPSSSGGGSSTATTSPRRITIRRPDDYHHHGRDGPQLASVLQHAVPRFNRCLMMPNLKPPVTTVERALEYKDRIVASLPTTTTATNHGSFQPLMTLYLTDNTTLEEVYKAAALYNEDGITRTIIAFKYYPAGATTNSDYGVSDIHKVYPALQAMQDVGMNLCIHSEVTHGDIFDREAIFIEEVMKPIVAAFPTLKITMEHISTSDAAKYILSAPENVKASITPQHLMYNRNRKLRCCVSYWEFVWISVESFLDDFLKAHQWNPF